MNQNRLRRTGLASAMGLSVALLILAAWGQNKNTLPASAASPFFEAKVRPLLLASCVGCHGKDSAGGGLRLDAPVAPDKAQEVIRRIRGEGGKSRMPLGNPLPADKIAVLTEWVKLGAPWPQGKSFSAPSLAEKGKKHWAFQPLVRPPVPKVKAVFWVRNPIDAFILKRLEAAGMKPSPPASRRELLRRVTYDLTGLPPTPEEVAAFEADKSPDAYTKRVDRLLASPHYGEQWARHWLDIVRYAESNSYERDNPKPNVTRYRDYVIRAFNEDKPYNRFVQEQIAGDEMPDATGEDLAATAYYRLGIWDDEPADLKQAEADDIDDLVATTGQAFLGLTLDCARCHDHKLDPIPQKDYYRFAAIFRNINRFKNGGPTDEAIYFATLAQKQDFERNVVERTTRRKANGTQMAEIEAAFRQRRSQILNPNDFSNLRYRYFEGNWNAFPNFDALKPVSSGTLSPAFLDLRPRKRDDNIGFVFEGTLNVPKDGNYTFYLDSDDGSRIAIAGRKTLEKTSEAGQGHEQNATIHLAAGPTPFRIDFFQGGGPFGLNVAWSGPGFPRRPLSVLENCSALGLPSLLAAELPLVLGQEKAAQYAQLAKETTELAKQDPTSEKTLCVTEAGPTAPDTFLLLRGNVTTPGDKVEPGFPICAGGGPAIIPKPLPDAKTTGRRLALANWLTAPANPLTARVLVNRVWQQHFGRGIVRTPNDFGLQGAPPTHPELLNWLAKEFVARGWSLKQLHRLILTSSAYQQSSRSNPIALAKDPQNNLFWRFDMRRLNAEEIRDSLLAVSGNLNPAMYGPSVYPEIPKEILSGQSIPGADWHTDQMKPEDVNRRSIYIHVKRSLIYPLLASFDLPETDRSSPARFASIQPTQALGMINGPLVSKQAIVLADRVRREAGTEPRAFARRVFALVLQRPTEPREVMEGVNLMARLQKHGSSPTQAQNYLCLMALNLDEFLFLD